MARQWLDARTALGALAAMAVVGVAPQFARAQIEFDGTLGNAVVGPAPVEGSTFTIRQEHGMAVIREGGDGGNLFHSFSTFNVPSGFTAEFSAVDDFDHVISRVTGGDPSQIDGTLRSTVGGADFWLINPSGVAFGPGARVDVPAGLHLGTADEVRFANGAVFSAADPTGSSLTVAPPEAFGFLSANPAALTASGTFSDQIIIASDKDPSFGDGATVSLVGGEIKVSETLIRTNGGRINIVAMDQPGEVQAATGEATPTAAGAISIGPNAGLSVTGPGGGGIRIEGGDIALGPFASLLAQNRGPEDAVSGIEIEGATILLAQSILSTESFGFGGNAGNINIRADTLLVQDTDLGSDNLSFFGSGGSINLSGGAIAFQGSGLISASTAAMGIGGAIRISGRRVLVEDDIIIGSIPLLATSRSGAVELRGGTIILRGNGRISTSTFGDGDAGGIHIIGGNVSIEENASISSASFLGSGGAGSIDVEGETIVLRGAGFIATDNSSGRGGTIRITGDQIIIEDNRDISSSTIGTSPAGSIQLQADSLTVRGSGFIGTGTFGSGGGGEIIIQAGNILLDNESIIESATFPEGTGRAGSVRVESEVLTLRGSGLITTSTYSPGVGGFIDILANAVIIENNSSIQSRSELGATGQGGTIEISADNIEIRNTGGIVSGTLGDGEAGTVHVDAGRLVIVGFEAEISSSASQEATGAGGSVEIWADAIEVTDGAAIATSSAGAGNAGAITIRAENSFTLSNRATVTTEAAVADAGMIRIDVGDRLLMFERAAITSEALEGEGGQISIGVGRLIDLVDTQVTSSVAGELPGSDGGDIGAISRFIVLDGSAFQANAIGGNGGNINVVASDVLIASPDSVIEATSERGVSGEIDVSGRVDDVGGTLVDLPAGFVDAAALLPTACAERLGAGLSSLASRGRAGLPADPERLLFVPYAGVAPTAGNGRPQADPSRLDEGAGPLPLFSFTCR